jgi:hypothetical protein
MVLKCQWQIVVPQTFPMLSFSLIICGVLFDVYHSTVDRLAYILAVC